MISKRSIFIVLIALTAMRAIFFGSINQTSVAEADGFTTIGTGTAPSCQSESAYNALAAAVAAGGVIDFDCGPNPVTMYVNTNVTDQNVTINGGGLITLSGEDLRQIFIVQNGGFLTLNDIHLIDGFGVLGGAVKIENQAFGAFNRISISGSNAMIWGGGIFNEGVLTVYHSTIGSNVGGANGGGIYNTNNTVIIKDSYIIGNQAGSGAGIYTHNGQLSLNRTTVRSNFATSNGGGLIATGPTFILNSTFSNNRALQGGAIFLNDDFIIASSTFNENRADIGSAIWHGSSTNSTMYNTIVANSLDTNGNLPSLNCDGPPLISQGNNLIGDGTCLPNPSANGDTFNSDPDLSVWYGSPIRGYLPNANSPAVNNGFNCPPIDQRGYPRPLGGGCDIGSMELGAVIYLPAVMR